MSSTNPNNLELSCNYRLNNKLLISNILPVIDSSLKKILNEISDNLLIVELEHLYTSKIYDPLLRLKYSEMIDTAANIINKILVDHIESIKNDIESEFCDHRD